MWVAGAAMVAACLIVPWWPRLIVVGVLALFTAVYAQWITRRYQTRPGEDRAVLAAPAQSDRTGAVLSVLDVPVIEISREGLVTIWNPGAARLLAVRPDRAAGRMLADVLAYPELIDLCRSGADGQARFRVAGDEGARMVEASVRAVPGGGVVVALRDVTELSRAVQVKSEFVANASHELRTPITALRMAVETLGAGAIEDPAMRGRLLSTIAGNTARLEEMVRDLLDLSRLESPEVDIRIERVPTAALAEAMAAQFEGVCRERNLTLSCEFDPGLTEISTDRGLVLLILRNLVENATKFAYEDTVVRLTGRAEATGGVTLDVADRGIGIPIQHQQRVFERYYQVDAARTLSTHRRGSGLGLAIVKHAVRRLGGTIRLTSVWKEGTTVTVQLPGAAASTGTGSPAGGESGP